MEFGEYNPAERKAVMNDNAARIATKSWKLVRISSTNTIKPQTFLATHSDLDLAIHNAGFTEATTKRFQEQCETLEDLHKINNALIATRIRMRPAKRGQLGTTKEIPDLPIPFAAYYNCLDSPMKRLIELMNVHLDEKQFNEVMIRCIKKELKSHDKNDLGTTSDRSEPRYSAFKCEDKYK